MTKTHVFRYILCAVGLLVCLSALSTARAQGLNNFAASGPAFASSGDSYGVDPVLLRALTREPAAPASARELPGPAAVLNSEETLEAVSQDLDRAIENRLELKVDGMGSLEAP